MKELKEVEKKYKNQKKEKDTKTEPKQKKEVKKKAIPLLMIDVNFNQGEKRKIYVFEGDTSRGLADQFAQEHGKSLRRLK